ncbi:MAG: universal stress protein [Gemmatimonadaceae bacterium]|nr:universal stress protein [Gemmatimonadaceae bacterium]
MYTRIAVPLDGSPFAEQALAAAIPIARQHRAGLELVHVHEPVWFPRDGVPPIDPAFDLDQQRAMRGWLTARAERVAAASGRTVGSSFIVGDVVAALAEHFTENRADLVVMATHGRGGISRAWLGSIADRLVRRISVPVLLIRPARKPPSVSTDKLFRHVLIPLDGSELAEQIVDHALLLAGPETVYTLLTVVAPPPLIEPLPDAAVLVNRRSTEGERENEVGTLIQLADQHLERSAARLRQRGASVRTHVVVHVRPARGIVDYAASNRADLIAIATHGRGGLRRVFLGSVADKVVRSGSTPMLLVRPQGSDTSASTDWHASGSG